jgi:hypothetical protein
MFVIFIKKLNATYALLADCVDECHYWDAEAKEVQFSYSKKDIYVLSS